MIVCTTCGVHNDDGESFCGDCGSYLEWEGERVEPEAAAPPDAPAPAPEPEPSHAPGLLARVKDAVGIGPEPEPQPEPEPVAAAPQQAPVTPTVTPTPPVTPAVPVTPAPPAPPAPSAPLAPSVTPTAPVAPAAPAAPAVAAVRPGAAAPRPRRRELPPLERPPAPGESICGNCGAGNVPTRKFCRRCGNDLVDAPVVAQPPWWKRLFARSPKAEPVAGTRHRQRRQRRIPGFAKVVGVLAALALAATLTRGYWDPLYQQVLDRVQGTKTVEPVSLAATSFVRGHPATEVRDGATNQFWAPAGKPVGQAVTATFASPFRLVILRVFNGASNDLKPYLQQSSPKQVTVTLLREGKGQVTKDFTLDDKPGGQELDIAVSDVSGVVVRIDSVYRPAASRLVALGEVEFLARD